MATMQTWDEYLKSLGLDPNAPARDFGPWSPQWSKVGQFFGQHRIPGTGRGEDDPEMEEVWQRPTGERLTPESRKDFLFVDGKPYVSGPTINPNDPAYAGQKGAFVTGPDGRQYLPWATEGRLINENYKGEGGGLLDRFMTNLPATLAKAGLAAAGAGIMSGFSGASAGADAVAEWEALEGGASLVDPWEFGGAASGAAQTAVNVAPSVAESAASFGEAAYDPIAGWEALETGAQMGAGDVMTGAAGTAPGGGLIETVINGAKSVWTKAPGAVVATVGGLLKGAMEASPEEQAQAVYGAKLSAELQAADARRARNRLENINLSRLKPTGVKLRQPGMIGSR